MASYADVQEGKTQQPVAYPPGTLPPLRYGEFPDMDSYTNKVSSRPHLPFFCVI